MILPMCFAFQVQIMILLFSVKVFDGVARSRARPCGGIFVQEAMQFLQVPFSNFAHPAAHGFLSEVMRVMNYYFGGLHSCSLTY